MFNLNWLAPERLLGMRRGIEKESLRVLPTGGLALTPDTGAKPVKLAASIICYKNNSCLRFTSMRKQPFLCLNYGC